MKLLVSADADDSASKLSQKFGLPEEFFHTLINENDWSFVIKLHAFIEAAVTNLLITHFKDPELEDVFRKLELSNTDTGKLAFCKKAGVITKEHRRLIVSFSQIRNQFVHDVGYCNKTLVQLLETFDQQKMESFVISFDPYNSVSYQARAGKSSKPRSNALMEMKINDAKLNPKKYIWHGCYTFMKHIAKNS